MPGLSFSREVAPPDALVVDVFQVMEAIRKPIGVWSFCDNVPAGISLQESKTSFPSVIYQRAEQRISPILTRWLVPTRPRPDPEGSQPMQEQNEPPSSSSDRRPAHAVSSVPNSHALLTLSQFPAVLSAPDLRREGCKEGGQLNDTGEVLRQSHSRGGASVTLYALVDFKSRPSRYSFAARSGIARKFDPGPTIGARGWIHHFLRPEEGASGGLNPNFASDAL